MLVLTCGTPACHVSTYGFQHFEKSALKVFFSCSIYFIHPRASFDSGLHAFAVEELQKSYPTVLQRSCGRPALSEIQLTQGHCGKKTVADASPPTT